MPIVLDEDDARAAEQRGIILRNSFGFDFFSSLQARDVGAFDGDGKLRCIDVMHFFAWMMVAMGDAAKLLGCYASPPQCDAKPDGALVGEDGIALANDAAFEIFELCPGDAGRLHGLVDRVSAPQVFELDGHGLTFVRSTQLVAGLQI